VEQDKPLSTGDLIEGSDAHQSMGMSTIVFQRKNKVLINQTPSLTFPEDLTQVVDHSNSTMAIFVPL
jgi:hypothetical protein